MEKKKNNIDERISLKLIRDKQSWNNLLIRFNDANIYQTWNFSNIVQKEKVVEHISIEMDDKVIGIAQVRIRVLPYINRGIAYIFGGPLFQLQENESNIEFLRIILNKLKMEYVTKRSLLLRIKPHLFSDQDFNYNIFQETGFELQRNDPAYRTLVLYLNEDIETIRKKFKSRWRSKLNQAEKNKLEVVEGNSSELYDKFKILFKNMIKRKKFTQFVNVERMGKMNDELSEEFKFRIFIISYDDTPIAGLVGSYIKNFSVYLLGATNDLGLKYKAGYLAQWEMIKWLKKHGCNRYDIGGINPERNPGGVQFKSGISNIEVKGMGTYDFFESMISKIVVIIGEKIKGL